MYEAGFAACCGARVVEDAPPLNDREKPEGKVLSGMYGNIKELTAIISQRVYSRKGDGFRTCILTDNSGLNVDGKVVVGKDLVELLVKDYNAKLLATFERVYTPNSYCYVMGWFEDCYERAFGKPVAAAKQKVANKIGRLKLAFKGKKRAA